MSSADSSAQQSTESAAESSTGQEECTEGSHSMSATSSQISTLRPENEALAGPAQSKNLTYYRAYIITSKWECSLEIL